MSLLNAMKQKKRERLTAKHPLYQNDLSVRYAYTIGIALVAAVEGKISVADTAMLETLSQLARA